VVITSGLIFFHPSLILEFSNPTYRIMFVVLDMLSPFHLSFSIDTYYLYCWSGCLSVPGVQLLQYGCFDYNRGPILHLEQIELQVNIIF
jgi:hypothetical protein